MGNVTPAARLAAAVAVAWLGLSRAAAGEPAGPPNPAFVDAIPAPYRGAVAAVMRAPTLSTKAVESPFPAHVNVYDWLVAHPDRTAVAWRRMQVPCVPINDLGQGRYSWTDPNGSELTWQAVAKFSDGVVWYATGKVKVGSALFTVPVKAVAVLRSPRKGLDAKGRGALFEPAVQVYLQTDSRAASTVLRLAGPAAPRMAEQGAEQLLLFFSGPARHIWEEPGDLEAMLAPGEAKR